MPAYNVGPYVKDSIQSVINSTYKNWELVIIDDGSTDSTTEICKTMSDQDCRIKYYRQNNQGLSAARNFGLKKVTGEFLMFLDSDDLLDEYCLEVLIQIKLATKSDIAICSFQRIVHTCDRKNLGTGRLIKFSGPEYVRRIVGFLSIGAYAWAKLYDTKIFENHSFPVGMIWEDVYLIPYIAYECKSITRLSNRIRNSTSNKIPIILHQKNKPKTNKKTRRKNI